ncbi:MULTISPECIES: CHAD domain-containing protein [unclassified Halomonas]|uniref:CHAD domain-containing protein n=1 Tax=unclassified Halomonas TaxID=2609666 RepID=UPI000C92DEE7|nr:MULTISPECIES: CHAD domain-containing protein [unclassified Halomonas]MAR71319.1 hypothetical protein [Halomonas sp.]
MAKALGQRRLGTVLEAVILEMLDEARQAYPRIQEPEDSEGLHDFRVALRRLRSTIKEFGDQPGFAIDKALLRQLTALARATNDARDGEVMLAWLDSVAKTTGAPERGAIGWWRERLAAQVEQEYASIDASVAGFPLLDTRLREAAGKAALKDKGKDKDSKKKDKNKDKKKGSNKAGKEPRFGDASAQVLARLGEGWLEELAAVKGREEEETLHRPRITGKRLRYLLRPWREQGEVFAELEEELKTFQDAFGDLHDDLVRGDVLTTAALLHTEEETLDRLEAALEQASPRATAPRHLRGFMLLHAHHEAQTEQNLKRVQALCRKPRLERLEARINEAVTLMKAPQ